jgi:transcriptional regulator with XRE-family HTH domain
MSDYRKAIKRIDVSTGDSVPILRELQQMSQNDLAAMTGIPQSTISAIENDRVRLGVEAREGASQSVAVSSCRTGFPWLGC